MVADHLETIDAATIRMIVKVVAVAVAAITVGMIIIVKVAMIIADVMATIMVSPLYPSYFCDSSD